MHKAPFSRVTACTEGLNKVYTFLNGYILLLSEISLDLFMLKVHQSSIEKMLIKALDLRH